MRRITLRTKLTVYSSLLVMSVVSSVGVSLYLTERRYLIGRVQQNQMEIVQFLAQIGREAITSNNPLLLSSYLTLIHRSRTLSYAMVLGTEGRIMAHSNVVFTGQTPSDTITVRALESRSLLRQEVGASGDQLVDLSLPIFQEGRRVGTARVGYSQNSTRQMVDQTLQDARRRIALATVVSLLLGVGVAVLLAYFIARPIQNLRDGARVIGDGDLDHRIEITSRDELGELAREFNIMAAKLQELDRLKQDFVSNVTHELRSPLTSLRGYVEFLLAGSAGPLTEEQNESLIVVKNNAMRLAKFIDNLLDVAKIEARKVDLHCEPLALHRLGHEMIVLFRPESKEKSIRLINEIAENIPPVWADAEKTNEIFINLISNAFKFTLENGQVVLSAQEEDNMVHLSVKDNGMGIPPDALHAVFNKFEQVKPTEGLVRKTKGTGLGLTIVKGFIEAHGGRVWIESTLKMGTTVHFTLPKYRPDEEHFTEGDAPSEAEKDALMGQA